MRVEETGVKINCESTLVKYDLLVGRACQLTWTTTVSSHLPISARIHSQTLDTACSHLLLSLLFRGSKNPACGSPNPCPARLFPLT